MTAAQTWNAQDYAQHASGQLVWARELLAKLGLQGSESVLDLGCGDGKASALLAAAAPDGKVLGLDLSPDMVAFAAAQFPAAAHPNLSFQQMDAAELRLARDFDVAFSNAALHWVGDHPAVLRGLRACLRPGGRLLFQMGGRGNAEEVFLALGEVLQRPHWRGFHDGFIPPYHFFGPREYAAWLPEAGFIPARIELLPKDMQHQGVAGFRGWLRTAWFPYTDPLPVALREAFLSEVVDAYVAAHPVDALGRIHVGMVRLEVEAHVL
jgi:trans-aconitate methyltransferase